jgi:serine/threonine-protein kinase
VLRQRTTLGYNRRTVRTFGKYRLVELLASGGMADVWRAEVTGAAGVVKEVALKLVRGEHEARSDFVRMFVEEARVATRLTHGNVVQVFEFDQVDGRYYLSMELVRGRDLGRVVERAREQGVRLGLARAVRVGAEVAKALAYVHRLAEAGRPLELVHRDVSPQNVLLSFEGEVKLTDFGIARAMSRAGLTDPGTLKGKIAYMAPEQARGAPVDGRADVFSLGVILWELCAGRRLFARGAEAATLAAVLDGPPPSPPSAWNEAVPPELDALVLGALERDPARRTRSSEELEAALSALLLKLTRTPEDWDLRSFMQRLWQEGSADGHAPLEETRVRTAPRAPAGGPPSPGADAEGAALPEPGGQAAEPTAATRTAPSPAPGPRRRTRVAALVLVLGAGAAGLRLRAGVSAEGSVGSPPVGGRAPSSSAERAGSPPAGEPAAPNPAAAPIVPAGAAASQAPGAPTPASAPAAPVPDGDTGSPPSVPAAARGAPGEIPRVEGALRPGVLQVNATPWAHVTIDGRPIGETPVVVELPPGPHRVRASHPTFGVLEKVIVISAGRREKWHAQLRSR